MKRIIAGIVLASAMVFAFAGVVTAQNVNMAPHRAVREINWRSSAPINTEVSGTLDSAVTTRLGNGTMILDTTVGVSTLDWVGGPSHPTWVVADSNTIYCTFIVTDAGTSSSTADSLYIMAQGSFDGKNYFNLATFLGGTPGTTVSRLDQTNATGTFIGRLNRFGASGGTPQWDWAYKNRTPITAAQDLTTLHRYPYLRWIVGFPDAVKYSVRARVMYSTTDSEE